MDFFDSHPDAGCSIELRDGLTADDYIARARRFGSTQEFREFRDASPEHRAAMRQDKTGQAGNEDRIRVLRLLKLRTQS